MNQQEIVDTLARVGLSPDEAATYVQLLRMGPSRAAEVAQGLRHSRPRVYRALDALAHRGFAALGVGRPRLYAAAPPATLFSTLRSQADAIVASVQKAEAQLLPELRRLAGRGGDGGKPAQFTTVRGIEPLVNQAHILYGEARNAIDLLFTQQGGRELFRAMHESNLLARRAREGLAVRLLVRSDPSALADWAVTEALPNVSIRLVDTDVISTCVLVDRREALVFVSAGEEIRTQPERAVGFRTDAAEFVAMQAVLFERLWSAGTSLVGARQRKRAPA